MEMKTKKKRTRLQLFIHNYYIIIFTLDDDDDDDISMKCLRWIWKRKKRNKQIYQFLIQLINMLTNYYSYCFSECEKKKFVSSFDFEHFIA